MQRDVERLKRWVAAIVSDRRRPLKQLERSTFRELCTLAWPIATAMAGETVIGLVDTKLVGGLGASALAGVGVGMTFMYVGYIVVFGLLRGVKVRTAHAVGRGTGHDGVRYTQAGLALGVLASLLVWSVARDATPLFVRLGIASDLVPYARDFFAAITWGAPGAFVVCALTQHRQAIGDSRTPMFVGIGGNVVNAALGYSLIYGKLGLPALGVRGAGYASAVVETLEAAVMLAVFWRDVRAARALAGVRLRLARALRDVITLGVPTGVQFGAEILAFATFTAILGSLGATETAAHYASMATIRISFLPGLAIGEAACVLVGQALGRRNLAEADRVTKAALVLACTFMAACGVVFATLGGPIARLLTPDAGVAQIAQRLLWVAAVFQVLDAVNIVLRGALRGAKDVRWPMVIGVTVIWTCIPTAALLLGKYAGWGALGGWCGFIAETVFASVLFGMRWRYGSWRGAYGATEVTRAPDSGARAEARAA